MNEQPKWVLYAIGDRIHHGKPSHSLSNGLRPDLDPSHDRPRAALSFEAVHSQKRVTSIIMHTTKRILDSAPTLRIDTQVLAYHTATEKAKSRSRGRILGSEVKMCKTYKFLYTCGHAYLVTVSKCRHVFGRTRGDNLESSAGCHGGRKATLKRCMQTSCLGCSIRDVITQPAHELAAALEIRDEKPTGENHSAYEARKTNFWVKVGQLKASGLWHAPKKAGLNDQLMSLANIIVGDDTPAQCLGKRPLDLVKRQFGPSSLRNEITAQDLEYEDAVVGMRTLSLRDEASEESENNFA